MSDINVHLLRIEGGPEHSSPARKQRHRGERKSGTRPIDTQDLRFASAPREDPVEGEKQARIFGSGAVFREITKLGRGRRQMIDNKISDGLDRAAEGADVFPGSKARIHLCVVNRVKSGVRAINGREKRQQVYSAEDSFQWPF
jgi:hypothetical protein